MRLERAGGWAPGLPAHSASDLAGSERDDRNRNGEGLSHALEGKLFLNSCKTQEKRPASAPHGKDGEGLLVLVGKLGVRLKEKVGQSDVVHVVESTEQRLQGQADMGPFSYVEPKLPWEGRLSRPIIGSFDQGFGIFRTEFVRFRRHFMALPALVDATALCTLNSSP